ncbi:hypothetical protein THAOC_20661 [Thalassiosira oceanica]|uniref:Uncharacterized protein n=1 Tax=Thalassiosira oceanica TaxID=159749 RepID=K0SL33_THAOC|nr:hypothetical protein THAOC_20661 [Thalassiosira oceanica]|eukprot:EJK59152.1 hypothetical protein THAOC_20661 [Thalassiosira oceanica]
MYVFLLALPSLLCLILSGVLMFVEFVGFIVGNVGAIASCQPPRPENNTPTQPPTTNPRTHAPRHNPQREEMFQAALRKSTRQLTSGRHRLPPAPGLAATLSSESNARTVTPVTVVGGDDTGATIRERDES